MFNYEIIDKFLQLCDHSKNASHLYATDDGITDGTWVGTSHVAAG